MSTNTRGGVLVNIMFLTASSMTEAGRVPRKHDDENCANERVQGGFRHVGVGGHSVVFIFLIIKHKMHLL